MLIAFHSKAAPEVLMLAKHALPLLAAAGKVAPDQSPLPERGVFTVEQLDATIAGIEQAIDKARSDPAVQQDEQDEEGNPLPPMARAVTLEQRAFPLLDLLKKSRAKRADVIWETFERT